MAFSVNEGRGRRKPFTGESGDEKKMGSNSKGKQKKKHRSTKKHKVETQRE